MHTQEKERAPVTVEISNLNPQRKIIKTESFRYRFPQIDWQMFRRRLSGFAKAGGVFSLAWVVSQEPRLTRFPTGVEIDLKDGAKIVGVSNDEYWAIAAGSAEKSLYFGYGKPPEPIVIRRPGEKHIPEQPEPSRRILYGIVSRPQPNDKSK